MALPNVKISFGNGALGIAAAMDDGCAGLISSAATVGTTFTLDTVYTLTSMADLVALGVNATNNGLLYKTVSEFYAEAPAGSKLYVIGVNNDNAGIASVLWDNTNAAPGTAGGKLLREANGEIRLLMAKVETGSVTVSDGFDNKVVDIARALNKLCEWATDTLYAPCVALLEGLSFTSAATATDLTTAAGGLYPRVGIVVGDTASTATTKGAAVGLVGGRLAAIPVHRCLARVRTGTINVPTASGKLYLGAAEADNATAATLSDKGYLVPRTFVGKAGYYWADDPLACVSTSDYATIARRRVIDKAYRIAYRQCVELIGEEIAVTADGKIPAPVCKSIEAAIEGAIARQMTANGELATDPDDSGDLGVQCTVDPQQNIVSTSKLEIRLAVRPYGYAKQIEVTLGFQAVAA